MLGSDFPTSLSFESYKVKTNGITRNASMNCEATKNAIVNSLDIRNVYIVNDVALGSKFLIGL